MKPMEMAKLVEKSYDMSPDYIKDHLDEGIHCIENGYHFDAEKSRNAVSVMQNKDKSIGEHWDLDTTNTVAKEYGVVLNGFNEYDWYYVLNMVYSDYYREDADAKDYVYMAIDFLNDADAPDGKAYRYYKAMKKEY